MDALILITILLLFGLWFVLSAGSDKLKKEHMRAMQEHQAFLREWGAVQDSFRAELRQCMHVLGTLSEHAGHGPMDWPQIDVRGVLPPGDGQQI